ncbi:hypothetical protein [Streptomyces sp. NPDC055709]
MDDPTDSDHFIGDQLLHTDWNPHNVLVPRPARLVDWARTAYGAGWIDPGLWVVWLIASGHTIEQAEHVATQHPAWAEAGS